MERKYKESGIEWIGIVPESWQSKRFKYSGIFEKGKLPYSSNIDRIGMPIIGASEMLGKDARTYTSDELVPQCKEDDILILWDGANAGITASGLKGVVSSTAVKYTCLDRCILPKYAAYLLKYAEHYFKEKVNGTTIPHMNMDFINDIPLLCPPLAEQQRIASYLDEKCGEIDSLIVLQEQMIEKLKAYKQSVITEAVTKGLDPNAKLVPSGIDWIGEIPEGWLVTDIKKLCISITDGSHFSPERQSEGMPYITAGDIRGKGIDYNNAMRIRIEDYNLLESQGCRPHKGDILMVKDGATTGRVGMMIDNEECVLLSSVAMLTPLPNVDSNYLMYLIQSNVIQAQIQLLMAGSAMPRVTLKKINSLKGLLIPLNDQHSIASYLDEKCADIDRLIALKQQKIESLKDYKKSVIYEAVTGKTIIE